MKKAVLILFSLALTISICSDGRCNSAPQGSTGGGQGSLNPALATQVGAVLAGRRVAEPPVETRGGGPPDLYRASVRNVPVVVSSDGTGSSVVIVVTQERHGWVNTNYHVVDKPFTVSGYPTVALLFYDAALKNELFNGQQFADCLSSSGQSNWCQAVRHATRLATVVRTDRSRDLALLEVSNVPTGVTGFQPAEIATLQPGDPVAVIGHPKGLLWSLTTGIISAIRTKLQVGNGMATVIQTQAPVNPGNSGGPLIGVDGNLVGVVFGSRVGQMLKIGNEDVAMSAEGLNYAIGIDEVLTFARSGRQ